MAWRWGTDHKAASPSRKDRAEEIHCFWSGVPLLLRGDPFDRAHKVKAEIKRRASFAPVLNGEGREMASLDALAEAEARVGAGVAAIWATSPWIANWRACWFWRRAWRVSVSMVDLDVVGWVRAGKTRRGSWGAIGFNSAFGVVMGGRDWTGSVTGVGGTRVGAVEISDQCGVAGRAR